MIKYIFLSLNLLVFSACSSSSNSDKRIETVGTIENGTPLDYSTDIDLSDDVDIVSNLAVVPHTKSSIPMLGILLSYNNQKIQSDELTWSKKLFGTSPHQLNHYYKEVSNSKFQFAKANESGGTLDDGIISVTLDKNHPNTDVDDFFNFESNVYPDLKAALEAVDDNMDFSNYDSDANGFITPDELLLTFIVAGFEDSYEGAHVTNGIWAHQYCTNTADTPTLDGVSLMGCSNKGNFAVFGELHDKEGMDSETHDATIGIIAHELGHSTFSLPDLYNTEGSNGGIGYFGIMGAGSWTKTESDKYFGNTPAHFSAWSKVYMKWFTPILESGSVTLSETSSESYNIIKIPLSANHYYLLENRNNSGYDRGLYSLAGNFDGGMAIWHINQKKLTVSNFEANNINNSVDDPAVQLLEAKKTDISSGGGGHEEALFYSPEVTTFTQNTDISNISTRGSTMSLNINEEI